MRARPPQWPLPAVSGCHCRFCWAAVRLTDYYWYPDGLTVQHVNTRTGPGGTQARHGTFIRSAGSQQSASPGFSPHFIHLLSSKMPFDLLIHYNQFLKCKKKSFALRVCSLKPSPPSRQNLPWSPSPRSSVKVRTASST